MGGPGVFLGHPCLYLRKTPPEHSGAGNYGHGHGDQLGSHVPEGILGYRISSHIRVGIKRHNANVFLRLAICKEKENK